MSAQTKFVEFEKTKPSLDNSTATFWPDTLDLSEVPYDFIVNPNAFDEPASLADAKSAQSSGTASQYWLDAIWYAAPNVVVIGNYGLDEPLNQVISYVARQKLANALSTGAQLTYGAVTSPFKLWSFSDAVVGEPTADLFEGFDAYREANWDGFNSDPITAKTVEAARLMVGMLPTSLGAPDVAPGADGTIGFEWLPADRSLIKLYIDVGPGGVWRAYWRRRNGDIGNIPSEAITLNTRAVITRLFAALSA